MAGWLQQMRRRWRGSGGAAEPRMRLAASAVPGLLRGLSGLEWVWRPRFWAEATPFAAPAATPERLEICSGVTLFHDGGAAQLALAALPLPAPAEARQGLGFALKNYHASYLSLALDLPAEALRGLHDEHLLRLDLALSARAPLPFYVRLNLRQGPNVEQLVCETELQQGRAVAEFDMFYQNIKGRRPDAAWIDLVLKPEADEDLLLSDLLISRRPRAGF